MKNHTQNVMEKLVSDPFEKKRSKLSLSVDQQSEILKSLFLFNDQVEFYENILKLRCWSFVFTYIKLFKKQKEI